MAANAFESLLKGSPDSPNLLIGLATALSMQGQLDPAIDLCLRAIQADPTQIRAFGILGGIYQRLGRFDDSIECAQRAIALRPEISKPYVEIVRSKRMGHEDVELLKTLEKMFDDPKRPTQEKFHIGWALGKAYDELATYERAMCCFDRASEIARGLLGPHLRYNFEARQAEVDTIRQTFASIPVVKSSTLTPTPLLIVGMIRSGTTLLDSLLCRRPDVVSAGELRFWEDQTNQFFRAGLTLDNSRQIETLAQNYRAVLTKAGPEMRYVIDKMPINHRFLGFILRGLPEAKIIHLRRHPADTCISIYTTDFGPRPPHYAFDRARIAHAYQMYQQLMDHWRSIMPADSMLEVDYEDLVQSTPAVLSTIEAFLELPRRAADSDAKPDPSDVRTPSRWQARQAVYRTSVGRWKNYEPWLKEFGPLLP